MKHEILSAHPTEFFRLIGHDIRWKILVELSHGDLRVQELVEKLNQPQNLISYHLQLLNEHGIVRDSRSAADGREIYYGIEIGKLAQLYRSSGLSLHPALFEDSLSGNLEVEYSLDKPLRVLFLCTHNSARSQMAEGILRSLGKGNIQVFSAGNEPSVVHPLAIRSMQAMGIDISNQTSKSMDQFSQIKFDYVITVCDKAREVCPIFPGDPKQIHWSFPDPAEVSGNEEVMLEAFNKTAVQLKTRIAYLLMIINRTNKTGAQL